jgi:hypothetical protein
MMVSKCQIIAKREPSRLEPDKLKPQSWMRGSDVRLTCESDKLMDSNTHVVTANPKLDPGHATGYLFENHSMQNC